MCKVIVICALEGEVRDLKIIEQIPVLYSGVGKINAAHTTMKAIQKYNPKLIVNYGSAGSIKFDAGDLVECTHFYQRDMNAKALGFEEGVTPYDKINKLITFRSSSDREVVCSSGDNFLENAHNEKIGHVFEMEAYSIANICLKEKVNFRSYKFISDGAQEVASKDWHENFHKGAELFQKIYDRLLF